MDKRKTYIKVTMSHTGGNTKFLIHSSVLYKKMFCIYIEHFFKNITKNCLYRQLYINCCLVNGTNGYSSHKKYHIVCFFIKITVSHLKD